VTPERWFDGRLVGFDLETTGLDREIEEPVSYAFTTFEHGELVDVEEGYVEPTRAISIGASGVHGLTTGRLEQLGAMDHAAGLTVISKRLVEESLSNTPIVGTNLAYDLTMIDRCMGRLAWGSSLASSGWRGPVLDVLVIDRAMDTDFAERPVRKLSALCEHYGVNCVLHTAAGDAAASVRVLLAQVARFAHLAGSEPARLHDEQPGWHAAWFEGLSAHRVAAGHKACDPTERAWPYLERMTLF
jgi:DNA polymerase III subunit epsilon